MRIDLHRLALLCLLVLGAGVAHSEVFEVLAWNRRGEPPSVREALSPLDQFGRGLFLIQAQNSIDAVALSNAGAALIGFAPPKAVLAFLDSAIAREIDQVDGLRVLALPAAWRSAPRVEGPSLQALFFAEGLPWSLSTLRQRGVVVSQVERAQPDGKLMRARLTVPIDRAAESISGVLQLANLIVLEDEPRIRFDDELVDQVLARPFVGLGGVSPGYPQFLNESLGGLSGQGITWAVNDTGVDKDHPDLAGAYVGGHTPTGCDGGAGPGDDTTAGGHGTHVAGILLGRALGDGTGPAEERDVLGYAYALGSAPATKLFASRIDCGSITIPEMVRNAAQAGAIGSNNSWSNGPPRAGYTMSAREFDILVRDSLWEMSGTQPHHVVFSAGNAASNGLDAPHEAKNIVTVGNVGSGRLASTPDTVTHSSSRGPAVDGRILPTLSAPGTAVASTRNLEGGFLCAFPIVGTQSLYAHCSGTSMSAPAVSGMAALAVEWARQKLEYEPSPALVKAILVNSTREIRGSMPGNPELSDGSRFVPNNDEGWGMPELTAGLSPLVQAVYIDQDAVLDNIGASERILVRAADPKKPLRVTLAWTDAAALVGANPTLVNDLDLLVSGPGQSYLGNVFAGGISVTGGTADRLANLENVWVANPGVQPYQVEVRAHALHADALTGNADPLLPRQDFALVCTNCRESPNLRLESSSSALEGCAGGQFGFDLKVRGALSEGLGASLSTVPASGLNASFSPGIVIPSRRGRISSVQIQTLAGTATQGLLRVQALAAEAQAELTMPYAFDPLLLAGPSLLEPKLKQTEVALRPRFRYAAIIGARQYRLELSRDPSFAVLLSSVELAGNEWLSPLLLRPNVQYFWRVRAHNLCGQSAYSSGSFTTISGDTLLSDGFGDG